MGNEEKGNWVMGFCFDETWPNCDNVVALIRKNKPEWQKGKLNGIGGSIKPGETAMTAMIREWYEGTGIDLPPNCWQPTITLTYPMGRVQCFRAFTNLRERWPYGLGTTGNIITDEGVVSMWACGIVVNAANARGAIPNLAWHIPLHKDREMFNVGHIEGRR